MVVMEELKVHAGYYADVLMQRAKPLALKDQQADSASALLYQTQDDYPVVCATFLKSDANLTSTNTIVWLFMYSYSYVYDTVVVLINI